jgi:hypothetical protein
MADGAALCAHCRTPIVDLTTQVVHGDRTYCCANCAAALEQTTGGSDPQAPDQKGQFRCAHCNAAIVDESTMGTRGDQAFCCRNCAMAMDAAPS